MSFVVVDASVWVSRLVPQDVFHEPVKIWFESKRVAGAELLSPALLLPEVGGAITRRTTPELGEQAVQTIQNLPGIRLVAMDASLIFEAARLAADLGLRGADATYVAVASRLGLPLATLDEDQRGRAAVRVSIEEI